MPSNWYECQHSSSIEPVSDGGCKTAKCNNVSGCDRKTASCDFTRVAAYQQLLGVYVPVVEGYGDSTQRSSQQQLLSVRYRLASCEHSSVEGIGW